MTEKSNDLTRNNLLVYVALMILITITGLWVLITYGLNKSVIPGWLDITSKILQGLLLAMMLFAGSAKLMGNKMMVENFKTYGFSPKLMYFTGFTEVLGGLGLVIGYFIQFFAVLSSVWLVGVMFGAMMVHIYFVKNNEWPPSFVLFCFAFIVGAVNLSIWLVETGVL